MVKFYHIISPLVLNSLEYLPYTYYKTLSKDSVCAKTIIIIIHNITYYVNLFTNNKASKGMHTVHVLIHVYCTAAGLIISTFKQQQQQ